MTDSVTLRIKQLEAELETLRSQIKESREEAASDAFSPSPPEAPQQSLGSSKKERKKAGIVRPFDFSAHPRRHVALRLAYLGWAYQGFACQENTDNTVEAKLFQALLKTRLIQDRQSSNYHRCGRTDRGVSAFSQVITIDLRSTQFCAGLGVTLPENLDASKSKAAASELAYVKMLNAVLPRDIRVFEWAPVAHGFSARFDCQSRTYRYYFPRGSLDVPLMADAAKRFEGTHDFRNLCKMDVGNGVLQFARTILSAAVKPVHSQQISGTSEFDVFMFEIKGLAFLYHQVRCMMAVLLMIGQKLEAPTIIEELLDVESHPRKPQYSMAVEYPLVLHDCSFEGLSWQQEPGEVNSALSALQQQWTQSSVRAHLLHGMIQGLEVRGGVCSDQCYLFQGRKPKKHRPLLERPCGQSLNYKIDYFVKRGRLEVEEGENGGEMTVRRGKKFKHSQSASGCRLSPGAPKTSPDEKAEEEPI